MAGTNLVYSKCDPKTQKGLDGSRGKEWQKWKDFHAGHRVDGEILDELLQEGHTLIPTQWIETDKKAHLKRPGIKHEPELKSRLVACGHLEDAEGIRADSPTCATEAFNMICSFAACRKLRLKAADLTNAYFTADPIDRLVLLKHPPGGFPGEPETKAVAMNKPVYGTKDAGRRFYKSFRRRAVDAGLVESRLCRSLYSYTFEGKLVVLGGAHVDDIIWAAEPEYQHLMDEVYAHFELNKIDEGNFRFCGREYSQDDSYNVYVTCKNNTEKILPISFERNKRGLDEKANAGEIAQARSVIGSLAWIARQTRPDLCYQCSRLQSVVATAKVKHLIQCNKVLSEAQATANVGIYFKAGVFQFEDSILISVHDASWANEEKIIDGEIFPRRSQYGRIQLFGDPKLWEEDEGTVHFLGWKSGLIKRLCRSTYRAETQGCCYAMESGVALRALYAEVMGKLKAHDTNWESNCAQEKRHLWMTDCQSLHDYLVNPAAAGCEDKRLEIDLQGLREYLWEYADGSLKDYIVEDQHDKIRWIDTSVMLCDPLTKAGAKGFADRLQETMTTGNLSLEPTVESQMKKLKTQKARQKKTLEKQFESQTEQSQTEMLEQNEPVQPQSD